MPRPNTEFVHLKGKGKWIRPDRVNQWGKWSMQLYPDAPSLEIFRRLQTEGVKNTLKKDDEGYFTSFSRPFEITVNGRKIGMQPPEILLADGTVLRDKLVGNGSDVTVKLEVYKHRTPSGGFAKAARWLSLRVDNLIPYEIERDFSEDQLRAVKGLDPVPETAANNPF